MFEIAEIAIISPPLPQLKGERGGGLRNEKFFYQNLLRSRSEKSIILCAKMTANFA